MMVILAGFNMSSTLTILTIEKRYEIGVLKTLGFSKREITWIFVLKAMMWGGVGALAGVVGGILIALNAHDLVKMIEPIFGLHIVSGEGLYFKEIPVSITPKSIILIVLFSLVVTLFSALIPSRRAAKQDAVEVLSS
jgi:lipoprotein-releasing system permease protein